MSLPAHFDHPCWWPASTLDGTTSTIHVDHPISTTCVDNPTSITHIDKPTSTTHINDRQPHCDHPHWPFTLTTTMSVDNQHISWQPTHHFPHPLFDEGKFYKHSRGAFMYIVYLLSINSAYCLQDRSQTGYQLVWTTTGPDQSRNLKRLTKTALNQLTLVQSSFSWSVNLWRPVPVPVFWNLDKRPDWTGLPSTNKIEELGDTTVNQLTYIRACLSPPCKVKWVCKQINISVIKKEKKNTKAIQLSGSIGNGKRGKEARLLVALHAFLCTLGGLYTPPPFPGGLRADSDGLDLSRMPNFWLWNCWNCPVTFRWLSGACSPDWLSPTDFPADWPLEYHQTSCHIPLEMTGQQRKVQWKSSGSPADSNGHQADSFPY